MPTSFKNARAVFAFSTAKARSVRTIASAEAGSAFAAVPPSGVGMA
ncbi:MAG TPA: hypothetical protein VMU46_09515 [Burkholderiales bacterium]|nr:hypothetical protein [Burkholderiales bacterium]